MLSQPIAPKHNNNQPLPIHDITEQDIERPLLKALLTSRHRDSISHHQVLNAWNAEIYICHASGQLMNFWKKIRRVCVELHLWNVSLVPGSQKLYNVMGEMKWSAFLKNLRILEKFSCQACFIILQCICTVFLDYRYFILFHFTVYVDFFYNAKKWKQQLWQNTMYM